MFGKKQKKYEFVDIASTSNESGICTGEKKGEDYLSFINGVSFSGVENKIISHAKKDFLDFLSKSCAVVPAESGQGIEISLNIGGDLQDVNGYKGRIVRVLDDKVIINAYDDRGVACALFDLEELITFEKAPVCKKGEYKRMPTFSPRMVHPHYLICNYPDGFLLNVLKEGIDAIVWFMTSTEKLEDDLNAKMERASEFGLDSYCYLHVNNFNHPLSEGAEKIYDDIYGKLFRNYPALKGVILVGESIEFPSTDSRVDCRHYYEKDKDGLPSKKVSPGWFPCNDFAQWIELVKNTIRKVKPTADVVFWTYNWGWAPEKERVELLKKFPTDISLLVTFEMFQKYKVRGITEQICDYSIVKPNASEYFRSEAKIAKERGIRLYAMANTGGATWDSGVMPFIPCAYKWKERYDAVNECREEYNISGLMEGHDYGYMPSFLTRLAKYCFEKGGDLRGGKNSNDFLMTVFENYFGTTDIKLQKAFKLASDAMDYFPPTDEMQYGPMRVGSAYPLVLNTDCNLPKYCDREIENTCVTAFNEMNSIRCDFSPYNIRVWTEIKMLKKAVKMTSDAVKMLKDVENANSYLNKIINMLEFFICSLKTAVNVSKFYVLKNKLKLAKTKSKSYSIISKIKKLCCQEIENAQNCIKFVELDSRLGYNLDMDYVCDKEHLEWKIRQVKNMMEVDLGVYINCLKGS